MRLRESTLAVLLYVTAVACSQPAPAPSSPPKPDLASEETAIRQADAQWMKATQARDTAAQAAVIAPDGVVYREHVDPLAGPSAFQAYTTKFQSENPKANIAWSTDAIRIAESGDLAVQTGQYDLTGLGAKGDGSDKGRFVTVWKKVNGEWKVANDIGSTTVPEPPMGKKP